MNNCIVKLFSLKLQYSDPKGVTSHSFIDEEVCMYSVGYCALKSLPPPKKKVQLLDVQVENLHFLQLF